jgi:hypothetical protein
MPAGFFRCLRGRTVGHAERRLAAAVLEDAVHSFQRNHGAKEFHRRLLYWEVEQWFASRSLGPVFAFERVCSVLGLNADEIRSLLRRWVERRLGGPVPMFLEWDEAQARRPHLRLVSQGRFPSTGKAAAIPGAKPREPLPGSSNSHVGGAILAPGRPIA